MLVLQAFVDESVEDPVFLMGGYIGPADAWASFSDRWQDVLDIPPRLKYLKMKEAYSFHGEFEGWSEDRRDARLSLLHEVIDQFASAAFVLAFDYDKFKSAFSLLSGLGKKNLNPYYFAAARLMTNLARSQENLSLHGPIKFIFDDRMMEKRHVVEAWDWAWKVAKPNPPNLHEIIGSAPSFEDGKIFKPLQAADMIAWWMRRRFVAQARGQEPIIPPWIGAKAGRVKAVVFQYNEQDLRAEALAIKNRSDLFQKDGK
jgi:hypothetical protein